MSPFTYFYIEPRLGLMQDDATQALTWHGYRPVGTVLLGFGYRLPDVRTNAAGKAAPRSFEDGLFVSAAAGPAFLANAHPSTWDDNIGMRTAVGIGKWTVCFGSTA